MSGPVLEFRIALTVEEYDRLVDFYMAGLGLEPSALWAEDGGHAVLFEMGKATLEIFDETHAQNVDRLETGRRTSGPIRFAMQVPDVDAALARVVARGATLVHEPVVTPWKHRNARVQSPDGMQITLFQVLEGGGE